MTAASVALVALSVEAPRFAIRRHRGYLASEEAAAMAKAEDEPQVQLATRIPKSLHRELKLHCVEANQSVMGFVVAALEEKLRKAAGRKRASRDG
jgi:predicted HicB family RNase H-like nuclease